MGIGFRCPIFYYLNAYICQNIQKDIMDRYMCKVCGYVYDPEEGDPESGVDPGTPFEELPSDWICPVCGVEKSEFEPTF